MAGITFYFDRRKAIETILYLANRISESDIYGICKLLYFTDKASLEKYGRFIFGDTYSAMRGGATPSNAYDLLDDIKQTPIDELKIDGRQVIAFRDANLDYLSKSDIECLDQIISAWGKVSNRSRGKAAHDDAYWQAWNKRGTKGSITIPVEYIANLFTNSDDLIDYLTNVG